MQAFIRKLDRPKSLPVVIACSLAVVACENSEVSSQQNRMTSTSVTAPASTTRAPASQATLPTRRPSFCGGDGSVANPYLICNANHLREIDKLQSAPHHYKLANDIDLAGVAFKSPLWLEGNLLGNGHAIKNYGSPIPADFGLFAAIVGDVSDLHIENLNVVTTPASVIDVTGGLTRFLKGSVSHITIRDSHLDAATINHMPVGLLIGQAYGGTISNISIVNSSIRMRPANSPGAPGGSVGLIVGFASRTSIKNSTIDNQSSVTIATAHLDCIGGAVGLNQGTIENVHSEASVDSSLSSQCRAVGGLVGANIFDSELAWPIVPTIRNSSVNAVLKGCSVGGIAHSNYGLIQASSVSGTITGVPSNGQFPGTIGGLVGANHDTYINPKLNVRGGDVVDSSVSATIILSGDVLAGGLVGWFNGELTNNSFSGTINRSAADQNSKIGGLIGRLDTYNLHLFRINFDNNLWINRSTDQLPDVGETFGPQ